MKKHRQPPNPSMKQFFTRLNKKQVLFAALFVIMGVSLLIYTRAASNVANFEVEDGTTASPAQAYSDTSASGGSYLRFGSGGTSPAPPPPTPPGPSPTPTPPPTSSTKPTATNTGFSGTLGSYTGPSTITQDGTVIQNVSIGGSLRIHAKNVTIRNFRLTAGGGDYGINTIESTGSVVIENGEISGMNSAGVYGNNFTARRLHVHHSGNDAFKPVNNVLMEYNYMHDLGQASSAHADCTQILGASNVTARYNHCFMSGKYGLNAGFQVQNNSRNILLEYNWMLGGGQRAVECKDDGGMPTVVFRYNRVGRDFGVAPVTGCATHYGNVYDDNGAKYD